MAYKKQKMSKQWYIHAVLWDGGWLNDKHINYAHAISSEAVRTGWWLEGYPTTSRNSGYNKTGSADISQLVGTIGLWLRLFNVWNEINLFTLRSLDIITRLFQMDGEPQITMTACDVQAWRHKWLWLICNCYCYCPCIWIMFCSIHTS